MKRIQLTKGKEALVSDEDFDWLSQWCWCALKVRDRFYAVRGDKNGFYYMHRELVAGDIVDHIDGDGLNNTRENLRPCTHAENLQNRGRQANNTSTVKGVCFDKSRGKWKVEIQSNGKRKHIGRFDNLKDAEAAYKEAASEQHGEFCFDYCS